MLNIEYIAIDDVILFDLIPTEPCQYMLNRLYNFAKSPYDRTLALDTDIYCLDNIIEMFDFAGQFYLAMCHGGMKIRRHYKAMADGVLNPKIPYAFAPVMGGLMLFKKCPAVENFHKQLVNKYIQKNYYDDQISMRELLWDNTVKFYILPREYGIQHSDMIEMWNRGNQASAAKIYFYGQQHHDDLMICLCRMDQLALATFKKQIHSF